MWRWIGAAAAAAPQSEPRCGSAADVETADSVEIEPVGVRVVAEDETV